MDLRSELLQQLHHLRSSGGQLGTWGSKEGRHCGYIVTVQLTLAMVMCLRAVWSLIFSSLTCGAKAGLVLCTVGGELLDTVRVDGVLH